MPDSAQELRRDLLDAVAADAALARPRPAAAVRARGRRRQRARRLLAVTTVLAVAVFAAQAARPDGAVPSRLAATGAPAPVVLDEGTGADGPWTLTVTEQLCLEHARPDGSGGLCGLAEPGRLQESSSFRTEDDGRPVVVVHGPVEDGTAVVRVELADRSPVEVAPVRVEDRLFFSARAPADAAVTGVVALGEGGEVLARLGPLPPPP